MTTLKSGKPGSITKMLTGPMVKYILYKLAMLILVYFIALMLVFVLPRAIPANPFVNIIQRIIWTYIQHPELIPEQYQKVLQYFPFDKPTHEQFLIFISNAFRGDFGISIAFFPMTVAQIIAMALPWTLALMIPSILISWTIGNLIGAYAGYKRGSKVEKFIVGYSFVVSRIPQYWLGMLLVFAFAYALKLFPAYGGITPGMKPSLSAAFIIDFLWHYTLPFLSIFIVSVAGWMGSMRIIIASELGADYIHFAESLGTKDGIVYKYAFRNSLLPQVTGLALSLGGAIAGQALVESIYSYPGMGYYLQAAIGSIDYPLIQGIFLILIATTYLANFLVDFIYMLIDPRIRIGVGG